MEDFKIILYILAAVAYFLFNAWRKAFKGNNEAAPPAEQRPRQRSVAQQPVRPVPQRPAVPPTSFEDILRELQPKLERAREEARTITESPVREAKPEPILSKYEIPQRTLSLENPVEAKEATKRAQLRRIPEFEAYVQKPVVAENKYAALLRNPATVRDAVILSEILKPKF
ncbi:hypothetical protein [Pontibacter ruber]|uniref:Uncharacterized protein n=1 Tax=Pontibacter ruber TaxID=1343895 RepID=A0ABW5CUQ8_9BACT|nr:hypothetical protein [Pontibacter ruber]